MGTYTAGSLIQIIFTLIVFARSFSALLIVGNTVADAHVDRYVRRKEEKYTQSIIVWLGIVDVNSEESANNIKVQKTLIMAYLETNLLCSSFSIYKHKIL